MSVISDGIRACPSSICPSNCLRSTFYVHKLLLNKQLSIQIQVCLLWRREETRGRRDGKAAVFSVDTEWIMEALRELAVSSDDDRKAKKIINTEWSLLFTKWRGPLDADKKWGRLRESCSCDLDNWFLKPVFPHLYDSRYGIILSKFFSLL